jgi:hypothetical protein
VTGNVSFSNVPRGPTNGHSCTSNRPAGAKFCARKWAIAPGQSDRHQAQSCSSGTPQVSTTRTQGLTAASRSSALGIRNHPPPKIKGRGGGSDDGRARWRPEVRDPAAPADAAPHLELRPRGAVDERQRRVESVGLDVHERFHVEESDAADGVASACTRDRLLERGRCARGFGPLGCHAGDAPRACGE